MENNKIEKMNKKRSKGVTFWGNLILIMGIGYGIINSARNIWRADYIILPILFVTMGLGILYLKNWARITFIIFAILTLSMGIISFPEYLQSINKLSKLGKGWLLIAVIMFTFRFIFTIGGIIFFSYPSTKKQFKGGVQ